MPAYIILDITVTDPTGYADYKELAPPALAKYNGKYLARGGNVEPLEGDWNPSRVVILEFPDAERASAWINSSEYAPARALRHKYATSRTILVEGVAAPY